jgi:hypothetical protein
VTKNRVLICTFLALSSGFFGGYIGSQMTLMLHSQRCQNQPWAMKELCNIWITPGATWQGSTTGIWVGTILGAFAGGLVIRENRY